MSIFISIPLSKQSWIISDLIDQDKPLIELEIDEKVILVNGLIVFFSRRLGKKGWL